MRVLWSHDSTSSSLWMSCQRATEYAAQAKAIGPDNSLKAGQMDISGSVRYSLWHLLACWKHLAVASQNVSSRRRFAWESRTSSLVNCAAFSAELAATAMAGHLQHSRQQSSKTTSAHRKSTSTQLRKASQLHHSSWISDSPGMQRVDAPQSGLICFCCI